MKSIKFGVLFIIFAISACSPLGAGAYSISRIDDTHARVLLQGTEVKLGDSVELYVADCTPNKSFQPTLQPCKKRIVGEAVVTQLTSTKEVIISAPPGLVFTNSLQIVKK